MSAGDEGSFCLVLHSHLPWLARHGGWPVGEEWLYQAWAHSYLPVVDVVRRLAAEGRRDVLTLGVTPVLAAQLDDPYCLRGVHDWLGNWLVRAHEAAVRPDLGDLGAHEHRRATTALTWFEERWRHGASPVLRPLADAGVIEFLGGPATHPFQPLLHERVRSFALATGLRDATVRLGARPRGIWAPECGYAPGMEHGYAAAGVERFLVDGPALRGDTAAARTVGDTDVVCFGRDLEVTYRVWSPRAGYPGDAAYRDFHTFDHPTGLKPARVTGRHVPPHEKQPYDPGLAAAAVERHVADFVDTVVARLREVRARDGRRGLVVAAYDTELFGHWWSEGPAWLDGVLRALPAAGVRVTTLRGAIEAGHVGAPVELPASSWGSGKDWRVWDGEAVADLVAANADTQARLLALADHGRHGGAPVAAPSAPPPTSAVMSTTASTAGSPTAPATARDAVRDEAVTEAMLALSSDWAFMVTKNSAVDYARRRAAGHAARFAEIAALVEAGRADKVTPGRDRPFGHLDARLL